MDKLERQLQQDAGLIKADISPELQKRIHASLESTRQVEQIRQTAKTPGISLWWASSLTGLAVAALVIVLINWNLTTDPQEVQPVASTPGTVLSIQSGFPSSVETADWATPLEEELKNLQSDLEKARENVERDLRLSF